MHCLWLCRTLPFPPVAGDRLYSAGLARALAAAGADVTFVGLATEVLPPSQAASGMWWHPIPGGQRSDLTSLVSGMPLVAARHATRAYRAEVAALLRQQTWDAVVIDYVAMGWALRQIGRCPGPRPVVVFVTHNHEATVTRTQLRDRAASLPLRLFLWQNHLKTRNLERRIARACDVLTVITPADARLFAQTPGLPQPIVLLPGYGGHRLAQRSIDPALPRAILMFGSYRWSAKQASLRAFLDIADPVFSAAGVGIRVIGDMDETVRSALAQQYHATEFLGYVDDPTPYLRAARLAVIAEPIGGGFKLKLLEYVFNRVPVAALDACAAGLDGALRAQMLLRPNIDALVSALLPLLDDAERLDAMQDAAFDAAAFAFDWAERGRTLFAAIKGASARRAVLTAVHYGRPQNAFRNAAPACGQRPPDSRPG